jgi:hypothetical protein
MPVYSTAGSSIYIGAARPNWTATLVDASAFDGETWTEIDGATSLGSIQGQWETTQFVLPNCEAPDDAPFQQVTKDTRPAKTMQFTVDLDADDAGQNKMLEAENSVDPYTFRIVFPEGSERLFIALVVGLDDVMNEANAALGTAFSLVLQSNVVRA